MQGAAKLLVQVPACAALACRGAGRPLAAALRAAHRCPLANQLQPARPIHPANSHGARIRCQALEAAGHTKARSLSRDGGGKRGAKIPPVSSKAQSKSPGRRKAPVGADLVLSDHCSKKVNLTG